MMEQKTDVANEKGRNLTLNSLASFCISAVEINCMYIFLPEFNFTALSSIIKELFLLVKSTLILFLIRTSSELFFPLMNAFISLLFE